MNYRYKFDPKTLANETSDAYSAGSYNSWSRVALVLAQRGFNRFEAEAILRSKLTRWARDGFGTGRGRQSSGCLAKYLDKYNVTPGCAEVNDLVMGTFGEELGLKLNDEGVPCREGTMPGNPGAGKVLVPLGTPACCSPLTELYWSM